MRNAFIEALRSHARENPNIFLVVGDLGYSVVEEFAEEFPDRFLNAGIAEQNMAGVASGLASSGYHVFVYSIANFPLVRCLEQIRNDICYHNRSVTIVSVGGGLSYGALGYSHHATEDFATTLSLPNFRVYAPGDPMEVRAVMKKLVADPSPGYLRLGKAGEPLFHESEPTWQAGEVVEIQQGSRVLLLTSGGVIDLAFGIKEELKAHDIDAAISSLPEICPLSEACMRTLSEDYDLVAVIEEHRRGGVGSFIAGCLHDFECMSGKKTKAFLLSLRINENPPEVSGRSDFLRAKLGMNPKVCASRILETLGRI